MSGRIVLLCAVLALAGCGPDTGGKLAVSGTVNLKGQPLDHGTIEFHAIPPAPTYFTGGQIQNGTFSVPAEQGLLPGTYKVRITAPPIGPAELGPPGEAPPPQADRIPPEYNANSQQIFEVKAGQSNTYDVAIP